MEEGAGDGISTWEWASWVGGLFTEVDGPEAPDEGSMLLRGPLSIPKPTMRLPPIPKLDYKKRWATDLVDGSRPSQECPSKNRGSVEDRENSIFLACELNLI